jgi:hypothetical protein
MSETDAFFTQTIVGAPMSVLLGCQMQSASDRAGEGLQIDLASGADMLSPSWRSWIIATEACAPVGIPRMRPTRWRRWLERYAILIATTGLLSWLATAVYWGLSSWR